jgi:hypothetical protein
VEKFDFQYDASSNDPLAKLNSFRYELDDVEEEAVSSQTPVILSIAFLLASGFFVWTDVAGIANRSDVLMFYVFPIFIFSIIASSVSISQLTVHHNREKRLKRRVNLWYAKCIASEKKRQKNGPNL